MTKTNIMKINKSHVSHYVSILLKYRVAEVVQSREGPLPKSLDWDENLKPLHKLFCRDIKICRDLRTLWKTLAKHSVSWARSTPLHDTY